MEAEIAVKWYEMVQTGLPMTALGSVFGPIALDWRARTKLATEYVPWALKYVGEWARGCVCVRARARATGELACT